MNILNTVIIVIQIISALTIIGLVLLQHGKGADMGASFGSGSSGSLFGASGSSNFLSRSTAVAATIFFVATLALAYFGSRSHLPRELPPGMPTTQIPASAPNTVAPEAAKPAAPATENRAAPAANNGANGTNEIPK